MQTISRTNFTTVKTEGALLPADVLQRIADGTDLDGLRPEDYHLLPTERLNEAINRAWNRCLGAWTAFDEQRRDLPDHESGTTLTRERWMLILFQELGYGRLPSVRSIEIDGTGYPISHMWEHTPFHLVTFRQELDRRSEVATAVRRSPHSLMQEFLNRSPAHLWGIIANGLRLRILRDNASLSRAAYVEFDLEAMMAGELYAEFSLLWLVCHQSRVEDLPVDDGAVPTCWLERWSQQAAEQGARALDSLRDGVQEAIVALGHGLLAHPANRRLKERLRSGELTTLDLYQQLRRTVYRFIFLFVAEDRNLLLLPGTDAAIRARYEEHYSLLGLRKLAETVRGGPHPDRYRQMRLLFELLREGYAPLGLPGLGSFLFSDRATPDLDDAEMANHDLLDAVRGLAFTVENSVRRPVDYRNLDSEELGSVYESLLDLHPSLNVEAATFGLESAAGSERKTTGSYYTATSLVNELLNSALEPVVADRLDAARRRFREQSQAQKDGGHAPPTQQAMLEAAILSIKVLDFGTGSGHMLIGAARRLARHLARIRSGDEEPTPDAIRHALRDVVRHCIYGVDVNDTAVELCKVALWMESLEPGKPLSFLDKNLRHGNSLLGVLHLAELDDGIPDDAFTAVTGDDKATARAFKQRNRKERESAQLSLFGRADEDTLLAEWQRMMALPEETPAQVQEKQAYFARLHAEESPWWRAQTACHLWTAAFFADYTGNARTDERIATTADLQAYLTNPAAADPAKVDYAWALARRHNFFHWEVEFPDVVRSGGFDVILSNPPWERIKLQEKEWFAARDPEIANAPNAAARRRLIAALEHENPALYTAFHRAQHAAESESHFVRNSPRYPLCGRGDVNTYAVFAELAYQAIGPTGRAGIIVPTGIATDDTTKYFFQEIMDSRALASLYDFENRRAIFPGVHRSYKFCLLTLTGAQRPVEAAEFVFFALEVADLRDEERRFSLTSEEIALLSPNTHTCLTFRRRLDAEIAKTIHQAVPILRESVSRSTDPWPIEIGRMFHSSDDSALFQPGHEHVDGTEQLRLYESKYFWQFDHRYASETADRDYVNADEKHNPAFMINTRYSIAVKDIPPKFQPKIQQWYLSYRAITNATNERTFICSVLPHCGLIHSANIIWHVQAHDALMLAANMNAYLVDYICRQSIGGTNLSLYVVEQLPILRRSFLSDACDWIQSIEHDPTRASRHDWLLLRALELIYTAWDLQPFAQDCGYDGPPFRWDEARRFLLRCELDAAYFHLYGIARDDVDYIMETFPIVKRKDEAAHGEYRTKRVILEIYDEMAVAMQGGPAYQTRLDPPPADPRVAHGEQGNRQ